MTHNYKKKFSGWHTLLFDRALFSLCNISSNIEKTEDNSLFGVKLLIHHWTSNLHDADYESTTMKARIQIWSEERGQPKVKQGQINQRILSRFLFHGLKSPIRVGKNISVISSGGIGFIDVGE